MGRDIGGGRRCDTGPAAPDLTGWTKNYRAESKELVAGTVFTEFIDSTDNKNS
jgi:hypothetical protein